MRKTLSLAMMLIAAVACTNNYSATVSGNIEGLGNNSEIVFEKLNFNRLTVVDTVRTDAKGDFKYKVDLVNGDPAFYYIYRNGVKLAGLVLKDGDKVTVKADTLGSYEVMGSEESRNLKYVDDAFAKAALAMDSALNENPEDLNAQLSRTYILHKREMLKHIMSNPGSITAATTLFQKFSDELPLFDEPTDIIIFRTVYDTLLTVYPNSEYVLALKDEIARREAIAELNAKLETVAQQAYPEISMGDINGKTHSLLSLEGKVIILSFWSVSQTEHKLFNQELAELYDKYHERGLEIYQVSVDADKPQWAATVRAQKLPWICVNDGLGINSPSLIAYNVEEIPAMFVLGREGDIIARNVFDTQTLELIIRKAL